MSIYRRTDGLFWPSLFSVKTEKEQKELLKNLNNRPITYDAAWLASEMLELSNIKADNYRVDDYSMQIACERVALKFILCDTDLAKTLIEDDDLAKAKELYVRKQCNSKLLQKLLCDFLNLLLLCSNNHDLRNMFTISIIDEFRKCQDEELGRTYGDLKKTVEKIASGVKPNCYYNAESVLRYKFTLTDNLNQFFIKVTGYDFNGITAGRRPDYEKSYLLLNDGFKMSNAILQLALVDSVEFWEKHKEFSVTTFLNEVASQNDIRHAEKILTYIIENIKKIPNMNIVFENKFPLYFSKYDELVEALEVQNFNFTFKCLERYCDITPIKSQQLCYPMNKPDPSCFEIGKQLWERFICEYNYPNDRDKVIKYLTDEVNRFVSGETCESNDIAVVLDCGPFHFSANDEDRELFAAYHPDCFSSDSIWKRVYLKAYAITHLSSDEQIQLSYMQRVFASLIKTIELRIGLCTVHQLDTSSRKKSYEKLKKMLVNDGLHISDSNKNDYIIALLDRDTALVDEAKSFPVLEQIGDAIYGFAVAELLFYDPDIENMAKKFEDLTRAEAQVLISKKLGFDKLYLQNGLPAKYLEYNSLYFDYETDIEEYLQALVEEKYLADSLEMIIGAIYRNLGLTSALSFAKKLLLKAFPEQLHTETLPTEENKYNSNIDADYWSRILPPPRSIMSREHSTLWHALNKVVLIDSIGTDDKDRRRYITNSFGNTAIYGVKDDLGISWVFYEYLNNGLDFIIKKYSKIICENYDKNIRY